MNLAREYSLDVKNILPVLKWAGGKRQLIKNIESHLPKKYNRYIEPFVGGGALYFHLGNTNSIIADSNQELINMYKTVAEDVDAVIHHLRSYENTREFFYHIRTLVWEDMDKFEAAARMIYLNRTCFNGLYRVNKKGQFNTPFGNYKKPNFCNESNLRAASEFLKTSLIIHGDFKTVLQEHAQDGDVVFLDPPYLPVSEYSDFKRYTKEQFYEEDHIDLANEVERLHSIGCHVVLTNSNHPLVHELFGKYEIDVVSTKRNINSNGAGRRGEDVIVNIPPMRRVALRSVPESLPEQSVKYPPTRYMGSKNKLLEPLWDITSQFQFNSVLDLFSGSGVCGYMFKSAGKQVFSNDYMAMSSTYAKAMIENNHVTLSQKKMENLLVKPVDYKTFVQDTFQGLYYTDAENDLIDVLMHNISQLRNGYEKSIALSALIRACVKKRPRGIFTYTGHRYDDGRKDLTLSLTEQFLSAVDAINASVFDNHQQNKSRMGDAMNIRRKPDMVYMDPPYYSPLSDNEYVRRYHFVEGIARGWNGVDMQWHTKTKKFKSYPTPFSSRVGAREAFKQLFRKFRDSIIIVSYSSNSLPTLDDMVHLMSMYKKHVDVISVNHRYSFGNQKHKVGDNNNSVSEYFFVGY